MNGSTVLLSGKMQWTAVGLVALQLIFKLVLELGKALGTGNPMVAAVAILWTAGWVATLVLCVRGVRLGYWLGASLGLMHFVMTFAVPMTGICDHIAIAIIVALHGLLISAACMAVLIRTSRPPTLNHFRRIQGRQNWVFLLLCVSTLIRVLWITFREPNGAAYALSAMTGKGGMAELAAQTLLYVVVISQAALCVIIPGIIMRKRWAFTAAAWFGGLHVVLTFLNVILRVNQGGGPAVVIPASLGMLIAGIWMLQIARGGDQVGSIANRPVLSIENRR